MKFSEQLHSIPSVGCALAISWKWKNFNKCVSLSGLDSTHTEEPLSRYLIALKDKTSDGVEVVYHLGDITMDVLGNGGVKGIVDEVRDL